MSEGPFNESKLEKNLSYKKGTKSPFPLYVVKSEAFTEEAE